MSADDSQLPALPSPSDEQSEEKERKIRQILAYKGRSTALIHNIKQLQQLNTKYENDLVYIQDYISKLLK
ncbi:uncharacterized protein LODBEIA_P61420 [Lodderomyces beijingensis]|uniref:Uncharacterized protein n=1 Tax=Lodderomyces beijingensis TaxID=1775926 RepID=A0ABP0ZUV1_9ASCO